MSYATINERVKILKIEKKWVYVKWPDGKMSFVPREVALLE